MTREVQSILDAVSPSPESYGEEELRYPKNTKVFDDYKLTSLIKMSSSVIMHQQPAPTTEILKRKLDAAYLLNASYHLRKSFLPINKLLWSKLFTRASIRIFGKPSRKEVSAIADAELRRFKEAAQLLGDAAEFAQPLLDAYKSLTKYEVEVHRPIDKRYAALLGEVKQYFEKEYAEAFSCFDNYPNSGSYGPHDVRAVFAEAILKLQEKNPLWEQWVVYMHDSAHLSVNPAEKKIHVGQHRAPIPATQIKGLFAHEVLIHAQRALNGGTIAKDLATGLPDYLVAEEGLGVLAEAAINGAIPDKVKDRYIDIALALGRKLRSPMSREEMYDICFRRAIVRNVLEDKEVEISVVEKMTWEHVNRIYRGTLGNKYVGVFTKDIAYYQGFIKIVKYLERARKKGDLHDRIEYCLQGKFDPTQKQHREVISVLTNFINCAIIVFNGSSKSKP